ncbi:MAG: Nif11-like leader peptide family natural product precursor [Eubacteriales bacterium]|nr:Nif11-like leader peptide family natural product precursor [Eubacteriales bacterium]
MSKMQELFEKVSINSALREKFMEIVQGTVNPVEVATKEKLITFAKEAGYDITFEEMQRFFKDLKENKKGELLEEELEMVAGGSNLFWYDFIPVQPLENSLCE